MSILPKHKSKFDKKFDELFGMELGRLDTGVINTLAASCPASLLPILAASLDVDIDGLDENAARGRVKSAFEIHYYSGTAWAVRKAVQAIDPYATVVEGNLSLRRDGSVVRNGARLYGANNHWAEYSIITSRQTNIQTAARLRQAATAAAPARCTLKVIESRLSAPLHDGKIFRDGNFSHGTY